MLNFNWFKEEIPVISQIQAWMTRYLNDNRGQFLRILDLCWLHQHMVFSPVPADNSRIV